MILIKMIYFKVCLYFKLRYTVYTVYVIFSSINNKYICDDRKMYT